MRKKILFGLLLAASMTMVSAQGNSGLGFNYQAIIRGADGTAIPSQNIDLRFSLWATSTAAEATWVETHNVTTDIYGAIGVTVGKGQKYGGTASTFAGVDFSAAHYWLKVEMRESGIYRELSYSALSSVPYAEAVAAATKEVAGIPAGTIVAFGGDKSRVPAGWFPCDGRTLNRNSYPDLYNAIGTAWGYESSFDFHIPDLRGLFLRGVDDISLDGNRRDTDRNSRVASMNNSNTGNRVGSYQADEMKSHNHGLSAAITVAVGGSNTSQGGFQPAENFSGNTRPNAMSAIGGSETRPKNVYVQYIIKY